MTATNDIPGSHVLREQEIGLRLPNGTKIFPPELWHDHPLGNAEDREIIVNLIKTAAVRLGYDEDHFLPNYAWISREKISAIVYVCGDELPITATGYIADFTVNPSFHDLNGESFEPDIDTIVESMVQNSSAAD